MGEPVDENIYELSPKERRERGINELPGSLKEASEALKSDNEYLKPIFTDDVIEKIVEKAAKDSDELAPRPHPYEFERYFDI